MDLLPSALRAALSFDSDSIKRLVLDQTMCTLLHVIGTNCGWTQTGSLMFAGTVMLRALIIAEMICWLDSLRVQQ